ncbi:MAG: V-type ATP synthase subunit I [Candidatus Aminicenantes bacterium]|nr:V-type ATP synthase subunit I [Candidatus Aminicenantes bacterium]
MSTADIRRVELIAHNRVEKELLSVLQESGLIHLDSPADLEAGLETPSADVSSFDHLLHRLKRALEYLGGWEKKGFKAKMSAQKPRLSPSDQEKVLAFDYIGLLDDIEKNESERNTIRSHIQFLQKEKAYLEPLEDLDIPVHSVCPTEETELLVGMIPSGRFTAFEEAAENMPLFVDIIHWTKRQTHIFLVYLKKEREAVEQVLREVDYHYIYFTDPILEKAEEGDTVKDVRLKIEEEIRKAEKKASVLEEEGKKLAIHRERLMKVHDVVWNERQKASSSRLMGKTERVFVLEGWIRSKDEKKLARSIRRFEDDVQMYTRPPLLDEEPPVALDNPRGARPFEVITKLYGLPQSGSMDPTLPLAPFFFIFVGLTVSEAGYGILIGLASLIFLKWAKPKGGLRQFLTLLAILSLSIVILGTLVGGWFGFPVRKFLILDPLSDPLTFLGLSLALGFIQVWVGTLLNLISEIKNRNYLEAIFVQGGWLVLLPGLVVYGIFKIPAAGILTLFGTAGIVLFGSPSRNPLARFFGGLYKLYDISGYLSDILSYSRLLALGLATGVIAMVVNTLCQTALGIPAVGWLMAAIIFVGGHLFNLGISLLGGFVHSMRLQFVEFFSKFFKAGGKPFEPFSLESNYVEFVSINAVNEDVRR